jgi:hypothetical protein
VHASCQEIASFLSTPDSLLNLSRPIARFGAVSSLSQQRNANRWPESRGQDGRKRLNFERLASSPQVILTAVPKPLPRDSLRTANKLT